MAPGGAFDALIVHEPAERKAIASPPAALRRDDHAGHRTPSAYELQQLNLTDGNTTPGARTPRVHPDDLEQSRPASPADSFAEIIPSLSNPPKNRWRYAGAVATTFAGGLNDSSTGVLIPSMEAQYGISYGIVSLMFVTNALGFITAAAFADRLARRLGRATYVAAACASMAVGYAMIIVTPPFWVVCVAFYLNGLGMAMNISVNNPFVANLTNAATLMGVMHGMYGVGGIISPIVATVMVENAGIHWSYFFALLLGVAVFNGIFSFWVNIGFEDDKPRLSSISRQNIRVQETARLHDTDRSMSDDINEALRGMSQQHDESMNSSDTTPGARPAKPIWKQTLSSTTALGSLFLFVYQGAEVSISGWVLSFLLAYRVYPYQTSVPPTGISGYDPLAPGASSGTGSLGYVNSGFWAGLTLSRMLATDRLAQWLGEIWAVALLTVFTIIFQTLTWLLPNLIAESVTIAIAGFFLGPVYPLATVTFSRYVERRVQVGSMAIIAALGSSGGAVVPFIVGIVSQGVGIWVLHPICLALYMVMGFTWYRVNKGRSKRRD